jgi:hypothetical protein
VTRTKTDRPAVEGWRWTGAAVLLVGLGLITAPLALVTTTAPAVQAVVACVLPVVAGLASWAARTTLVA